MLNTDVHFDRPPEAVVVMLLPDGKADIWIHKGIDSAEKTEDGKTYTDHFAAEEAYARMAFDGGPEEIAENIDEWFDEVAAWQPPAPANPAPQEAEIAALKTQLGEIASKVGSLEQQGEVLTECILEMSEQVYA